VVRQFTSTPDKLPYDHHEPIGLIASRAVLYIARMGAEASQVDHLVYQALEVPDRMGATEENTNHCT